MIKTHTIEHPTLGGVSFESDGRTLWINTAEQCLGRFSPSGYDVMATTHHVVAYGTTWKEFVGALKSTHGLDMPREVLAWRAS